MKCALGLRQYLETAIWAETDSEGNPLDDNYCIEDFAPEALKRAEADLANFLLQADELISGLELSDVVHDFWLTRNRHGVGFWDADYCTRAIGLKLTDLAHSFGEVDIYVGDDSLLYFV